MRIIIGSDHRRRELKEQIWAFFSEEATLTDIGPFGNGSVDYPDPGRQVAEKVSSGEFDLGIVICGSGIGMSIVANKFPRVRAAMCHDARSARMSRNHNNANVLVLGADSTFRELATHIVD